MTLSLAVANMLALSAPMAEMDTTMEKIRPPQEPRVLRANSWVSSQHRHHRASHAGRLHLGIYVAVLRTTTTVLLPLMTSIGRQMYRAAFMRQKPVMTIIIAPLITNGRSPSGFAMSPRTNPTCVRNKRQFHKPKIQR